MVYLPTASSDFFLILGCMTSNALYLSFSTFYCSSLWRTDTIVFAKSNKPPSSGFEINNPNRGGEGGGVKTAHLNGHTLGFHSQPQKLEPPCTA